MIAYVSLITIFFISGIFFRHIWNKDKAVPAMITIFFIGYLFLLCFRADSVGADTQSYLYRYFYAFHSIPLKELLQNRTDELGFVLFVKVLALLTENGQLFLAVSALVSVLPIMIFYRKESTEAAVCCSFFMISLLFEFFFSGIRQGIAIGLAVPAYYYTRQKKLIHFIFIVALAVSFHVSAIMIAFIYPIYHARITSKWLWFVIPSMMVVYLNRKVVFTLLFELFGGKYFEKYSALTGMTKQYGLLALFIMLSVYCFIVLDENASQDNLGLRNILLIATMIQFFAPLHSIVSRMNYYFILFIPVVITRTNSNCKFKSRQITRIASFVMTMFFVFYFVFMKGDPLRIMDYSFCF